MTLSIIVPIYNGEHFIKNNFNNVLSQKLDSFEIIYVDNNSQDDSFFILKQLEKKHSFVKVFKETKQGAGAARNKGVEIAKGKYICFLDVDDLYYEGILNKYLKVLELDSSISSVYGKYSRNTFFNQNNSTNKIFIKEPPFQGVEWFTHFSKLPGTPAFMHRIDVVKDLRGFPESIKLGEDAAFHVNLGLNHKIAFLDSYAYCYFRHTNSTTSKNNTIESLESKYFNQYCKYYIPEFFENQNFVELRGPLNRKVFNAIGRLILEENSIMVRFNKYIELKNKIRPIKIPAVIEFIYYLICITNHEFLRRIVLTRVTNILKR